jgi:hypothetical protein
VTWLFVVLAIAVLAFAFLAALASWASSGCRTDLKPDTLDGEPAFDVVVRGYRMDEVDEQIASLQTEIDHLRRQGAPVASDVEPDTAS